MIQTTDAVLGIVLHSGRPLVGEHRFAASIRSTVDSIQLLHLFIHYMLEIESWEDTSEIVKQAYVCIVALLH